MAVIRGTNGNDTLNGTANADDIFGLAGDDRLSGLGGNDTLFGGRGNDRIDGGAGVDTLSVRDASGDWDIDLASGIAEREAIPDVVAETDQVRGFENVDGSAQNDSLSGNAQANVINGNDGIDGLDGGAGDDILRGGSDIDSLRGGAGNDRLDGGASVDSVDYFFEDGETSDRAVRLDLASGRAVRGEEVDTLISIEDASGSVLNDVLLGNGGANDLDGSFGADRIEGRGGADVLRGGDGDDTLNGGAGSDVLFGRQGGGDDHLTGGSGDDTFDFAFVNNNSLFDGDDVVTDFSQAQGDKIASGVFFTNGRVIRNPFDQFDTDDNGRIDDADGASRVQDVVFDSSVSGGSTVLSIDDVEGNGGAIQLTLVGGTDLRESDFVLT